jgi:hypothetical protein
MHIYELRACEDIRGINLLCDALHSIRLWQRRVGAPHPKVQWGRSHHAMIRVYDAVGNVMESPEHAGDSKE